MSVLSMPHVTPADVFSAMSVARTHDGRISEEAGLRWLYAGTQGERKGGLKDAFRLAEQLGFVAIAKGGLVTAIGTTPATRRAWAAAAHERFRSVDASDPDALLLRVYAWYVARVEKNGRGDFLKRTAEWIADAVEEDLNPRRKSEEARLFNPTKFRSWKDWMAYLGLGWNDVPGIAGFVPDVTTRLAEELPAVFGKDRELTANEFLKRVASAMPYLDGGPLFTTACRELGVQVPASVSKVLSEALRSLQDEGAVTTSVTGDQAGIRKLAAGHGTAVTSFSGIRLGRA